MDLTNINDPAGFVNVLVDVFRLGEASAIAGRVGNQEEVVAAREQAQAHILGALGYCGLSETELTRADERLAAWSGQEAVSGARSP